MASPGQADEIELKFQVPPGRLAALRRAVATRSAETVTLRARYFDTDDGRLAEARLAWRLRHEGGRWVQTLKGPGDGLAQRLEHEVPRDAADGDPPAPDAALHAGHPAGAVLARALKGAKGTKAKAVDVRHGTEITRTRRVVRHLGARIELALDEGFIVAGDAREPIAELELELLSGTTAALLDLAAHWAARFELCVDPATKSERAQWLAAGLERRPVARADEPAVAAGAPLHGARAAMVASTLAHALPNAAAVTAGRAGPEHVHQLRVALRRLRTVLRALGPADADRDAALRALFAQLGAARDADVMLDTLAPAWKAAEAAGWPRPPAPVLEDHAPDALRAPAAAALWLSLLSLAMPSGPEAAVDAPAWDRVVLERLRRWRRRVRRLAAEWDDLDTESRHRLRKQLKRLRYLLEFAAPLLPARRVRAELEHLRPLQEALGRWNDLAVAQAHLAANGPPTPAMLFAAGWLVSESAHAEAECRRAVKAWRAARDGLRRPHLAR